MNYELGLFLVLRSLGFKQLVQVQISRLLRTIITSAQSVQCVLSEKNETTFSTSAVPDLIRSYTGCMLCSISILLIIAPL